MGKSVVTRGQRGTGRGREAQRRNAPSAGETPRKTLEVSCIREPKLGRLSPRVTEVGMNFGIPLYGSKVILFDGLKIPLVPGGIVLLLGSSGSGKTSALAEVERRFAGGCMVNRVSFPSEAAVVDRIAPGAELAEAVSIMTSCGFSEPHLWVRRFAELSDGEKFRAQLARAIALQSRPETVSPLLCDEYCSTLHRRVAKAISFNLHKLIARGKLTAVLASSNADIVADLQPRTIIHCKGFGTWDVEHRDRRTRRSLSFRRRLRIERGSKRDYDAFAAMHYRATDELGFVDKVFVLREGTGGDPLGIVVYAHSPLELSLRNQATDGWFVRNPQRVNRCLRILRRLVIHPDVRGCGLGHYLVQRTLAMVGTEYIECLAAMGEFNPVFEKAAMTRIGQYAIPAKRRAALAALRALDVDPHRRDFSMKVFRSRRVREIVSGVVYDWYRATTGGGEKRVQHQSPQILAQTFRGLITCRPVYYLWQRGNRRDFRSAHDAAS